MARGGPRELAGGEALFAKMEPRSERDEPRELAGVSRAIGGG